MATLFDRSNIMMHPVGSPISSPRSTFDRSNDTMVIPPLGSPISPKSVMMVGEIQEEPTLKLPSMVKKEDDEIIMEGSRVYHYQFFARPPDSELRPILEAISPLKPSLIPKVIPEAIMDDILIHKMKLLKSNHNIFSGYLQGRRIVLVRMPDEFDRYFLACSDSETANNFFLVLRSLDVQVQEVM